MRILYIHQYFRTPRTGWGLRSWHIARHWAELGHEVLVVTAYDGPAARTERHGNLTVHWLPIPYSNAMPRQERIQAFRRFVTGAIRVGKGFLPADLVYATSTPLTVGLAALWLKRRYGVPFVFEVRDLWPEAPIQLGQVKGVAYKAFLRRLEKEIYRQAQSIVTLSPPVQRLVADRVPGKSIILAPNFTDGKFFIRSGPPPSNEVVQVCYTGTFGRANDIPSLMAFIKAAQERKGAGFHFHLAGDGAYLAWAEAFAREHQLSNLRFYGHLDTLGVRDVLHLSHYAWVGFGAEPILETNSPNKFFDALAAGTPILLSAKGWLKDLIEEDDIGLFVDEARGSEVLDKMEHCVQSGGWAALSGRTSALAERFSKERTLESIDEVIRKK